MAFARVSKVEAEMANVDEGQGRKKNGSEWLKVLSISVHVWQEKPEQHGNRIRRCVEVGSDSNHVPCYQENDGEPYAPLAYGN